MVKDEGDVIEEVVRHLATQVDEIIIADNGSTDGTREILEGLAREIPLTIINDPDPAYYQSAKMTRLAALAASKGATWVLPVDADEIWYSPFGSVSEILRDADCAIATALLYDHVATGADPKGSPVARTGWRRIEPAPLFKVACRPSIPVTITQGNHGANYRTGSLDNLLVVRHFPYRSADQFIRKVRNGAAAYAATDLPEFEGAHWRQYGKLLEDRGPEVFIDEVFRRYFWVFDPTTDATLIYDPCPATR